EERGRSEGNELVEGGSTALPTHLNPGHARVRLRLKQHGSSGSESASIPPASCRRPCTLRTGRQFDPRGQDALEQRLGVSLPNGRCLRNCRRRTGAANAVQSDILSSRKSRGLRTLAWSQLGLDCWASDLPFSFQHWPTNLHLWTRFSGSEIKKSCFHYRDTDQHSDFSNRFCSTFGTRELLAC